MSTKTTFKRVALVTVAALGFGLLSVAPSSATSQSDTLTLGSATTTMAVGSNTVTNTITQAFLGVSSDTMSVTVAMTSSPAGNAAMPALSITGTHSNSSIPVLSTDGLTVSFYDTGTVSTYRTCISQPASQVIC